MLAVGFNNVRKDLYRQNIIRYALNKTDNLYFGLDLQRERDKLY